jgi:hypothetical protein
LDRRFIKDSEAARKAVAAAHMAATFRSLAVSGADDFVAIMTQLREGINIDNPVTILIDQPARRDRRR